MKKKNKHRTSNARSVPVRLNFIKIILKIFTKGTKIFIVANFRLWADFLQSALEIHFNAYIQPPIANKFRLKKLFHSVTNYRMKCLIFYLISSVLLMVTHYMSHEKKIKEKSKFIPYLIYIIELETITTTVIFINWFLYEFSKNLNMNYAIHANEMN